MRDALCKSAMLLIECVVAKEPKHRSFLFNELVGTVIRALGHNKR